MTRASNYAFIDIIFKLLWKLPSSHHWMSNVKILRILTFWCRIMFWESLQFRSQAQSMYGGGEEPLQRIWIWMCWFFIKRSHYLNQCCLIVNGTPGNKLQWNFSQNTKLFIHENAYKNVVCKMAAILFRLQCVNTESVDVQMSRGARPPHNSRCSYYTCQIFFHKFLVLPASWYHTVRCRYNTVDFLKNINERHP